MWNEGSWVEGFALGSEVLGGVSGIVGGRGGGGNFLELTWCKRGRAAGSRGAVCSTSDAVRKYLLGIDNSHVRFRKI
jgi:hypothetical protein